MLTKRVLVLLIRPCFSADLSNVEFSQVSFYANSLRNYQYEGQGIASFVSCIAAESKDFCLLYELSLTEV